MAEEKEKTMFELWMEAVRFYRQAEAQAEANRVAMRERQYEMEKKQLENKIVENLEQINKIIEDQAKYDELKKILYPEKYRVVSVWKNAYYEEDKIMDAEPVDDEDLDEDFEEFEE